ncbi:MAG: glycosyltransferase family 1 protein [Patescibacteria group bacterium]
MEYLKRGITIAVNARMLLKNRLDGIGWIAYHTLKRMVKEHPEVNFIFLFDRPYDKEFIFGPNVTPYVVWPPTRHPLLSVIWFQIAILRILKKIKPDLFLSHDGIITLGAHYKQLSVICDINFFHYPKDLPFAYRTFFNYFFPRYASQATRVATLSNFCKKDIVDSYHINPDKVDVMCVGVDNTFIPLTEEEQTAVRATHTQGKKYFIFVGSLHHRKNIVRLMLAFDQFKEKSGSDMKLVLAGSFFWGKEEIDKTLQKMRYKDDVIFTGRVSDEAMPKLLASAFCLTFVSYFEGFGMPLIEAMRAQIPIITSTVTSLPEVAGNAALCVDPFSVEEISEAMLKIYKDEALRHSLIQNGIEQCKKFTWDASTQDLWSSIAKTLSGGSGGTSPTV